MNQPMIDAPKLHEDLESLARIGSTPDGGITRVAFSDADLEGREFVKDLMADAGLTVRIDAAGNIFGRRKGREDDLPAILMGSHTDTVPDGGAYDGALGVLAAIAVARSLEAVGWSNRHPFEVAVWSDEEGALTGSRAFIGELDVSDLDLSVVGGLTLAEGLRRIGGDPEKIGAAKSPNDAVLAYLELHVEQGDRLETQGKAIGVVTGIVGIRHYAVRFDGIANHAGTTPMEGRSNALLGACDFVLAVDRTVKSMPGFHVGTVGELTVRPGAPNVIPAEVDLTVELRDLDSEVIDTLWGMLQPELTRASREHGLQVRSEQSHGVSGIQTDANLQSIISGAADNLGLDSTTMPSGAGHDAQNLAKLAPTGMIFVPSVGGVSHSREEYTRPEDVKNGAEVLLNAVLEIDRT